MRLIITVVVCLFLTACSANKTGEAVTTVADPTQTPKPTSTVTRVPAPTSTSTTLPQSVTTALPTFGPTQTMVLTEPEATAVPYPTRTPLIPTPLASADYNLVNWTPELADQLITSLQTYPDGLDYADRGYHDSGYYYSYDYARVAQAEALLRFPDSSFAETWAWGMAYNMAQMGHPDVNQTYADILSRAIQVNETDVEQLGTWFKEHEPRLNLRLIPLTPPLGYSTSYLVEIAYQQQVSGIYIWVAGGPHYTFYPLQSCDGCFYGDFGFSSANGISFVLEDVTGDGNAEILTEHTFFPGSGDALTTDFDVFDVSHIPYQRIEFIPPISSGHERTWTILPDNGNGPGMMFEFIFDRYTCPFISYQEEYRLENGVFVLVDETSPDPSQIATEDTQCADGYFNYLMHSLELGDRFVLDDIERWVENWPYSDMPSGILGYETQSPDDRDGARFAIGLYLALNGENAASIQQMNTIISSPTISSSRWVETASIFLGSYHSAADLPNACAATGVCYELLGVKKLVELYRDQGQATTIVDYLISSGTPITAQGLLDVNNDGCTDYWLTLEYPEYSYSDAWLIVCWEQGYRIFQLSYTRVSQPLQIRILSPLQGFPVFLVNSGMDEARYILYQNSDTSEIQLDEYYFYIHLKVDDDLDRIEKELMTGKSPEDVLLELQIIEPLIRELENEEPQAHLIENRIPRWYYLLGLTYELLGNSDMAAEAYFNVWEHYPDSPYGMMSRSKLQLAP